MSSPRVRHTVTLATLAAVARTGIDESTSDAALAAFSCGRRSDRCTVALVDVGQAASSHAVVRLARRGRSVLGEASHHLNLLAGFLGDARFDVSVEVAHPSRAIARTHFAMMRPETMGLVQQSVAVGGCLVETPLRCTLRSALRPGAFWGDRSARREQLAALIEFVSSQDERDAIEVLLAAAPVAAVAPRADYAGVSRLTRNSNRWRVDGPTVNGKRPYLGIYDREEDAARAYDAHIVEQGYPGMALNFPSAKQERR